MPLSLLVASLATALCSCSPVPSPSAGAEPPAPTASETTSGSQTPAPTGTGAPAQTGTGAPAQTGTAAPAQTGTASGTPSSTASAGECASCVTAKVSWGWVGGNAMVRDQSVVEPCQSYQRTRTSSARAGGQPPISCKSQLACDASAKGSAKLAKLMSAPAVQKALTSPMTIYGCDQRAFDGALYGVETEGGKSFGVGAECKGCSSPSGQCVPPPAAVSELVAYLRALDEKMATEAPCKALFGSP